MLKKGNLMSAVVYKVTELKRVTCNQCGNKEWTRNTLLGLKMNIITIDFSYFSLLLVTLFAF